MSFAYAGDRNRISKDSTYFVNDVNLPLTQVLLEQDEAGTTLASYTYGLELISRTKGESTHYYIYDGLGNVVAVTDETGQTVQTYDYDAFGNVISTTGELTNPYQFVGGYGCTTEDTGLIYMRARYYMSEIGRFTSRDPIWGSCREPLSLNRYIYVRNNPANLIDPSGLWEYGNWCGRGWSAHKRGEPSPNDWKTVGGVDWLDDICKEHDACFQNKDPKTGRPTLCRKRKEKCNEEMCDKLLDSTYMYLGKTGIGLKNRKKGRWTYKGAVVAFCAAGAVIPYLW